MMSLHRLKAYFGDVQVDGRSIVASSSPREHRTTPVPEMHTKMYLTIIVRKHGVLARADQN